MSLVKYDIFEEVSEGAYSCVATEVEGHNPGHVLRQHLSDTKLDEPKQYMVAPSRNVVYLDGAMEIQLKITEAERPVPAAASEDE